MKLKDWVIGGGVVIALVVAFTAVGNPSTSERIIERVSVGGASGPEKTEHQIFRSSFTTGGNPTATSTEVASQTLAANDVINSNDGYVEINVGLNMTLTTMASTSAPFVGLRTGESFSMLVYSSTTTAATTLTWAAGTGIDLQEDEGGTVVQNGLEIARLTFVKKADTDIAMWVEVGQVGD